MAVIDSCTTMDHYLVAKGIVERLYNQNIGSFMQMSFNLGMKYHEILDKNH